MERIKIYNSANGKCTYCGESLDINNFHIDHFIPKSSGGKNPKNLVASCPLCNLIKGNLSVEEFRKKLENMALIKTGKIGIINKYWNIKPKKIKFYYEEKKDGTI